MAATQLRTFTGYVENVGTLFVAGGGEARGKPKASSVPFFLSYFWQIQARDRWPVYYTNSVQVMEAMNLFIPTGEVGADYLAYKHMHETLLTLFSRAAGQPLTLYDVEHVFWFKGGHMAEGTSGRAHVVVDTISAAQTNRTTSSPDRPVTQEAEAPVLPDSYVPPVVAIIPRLALNDPELQEMARRSGTTVERALEKSVNAAFTVLGYEAQLLGQGMGRVPDGQAVAADESYACIWDTKARAEGYNMGTDDRVIRQYIETQSRSLKRRGLRNIYYLIISSSFSDDFDDLIATLKMETNVNEVCLLEATALVAVVEQKLRGPLSVSLGSDGIQRLFSSGGIITANDVAQKLA